MAAITTPPGSGWPQNELDSDAPEASIGPRQTMTYVVSCWGEPTQTFVRREAHAMQELGIEVSALSIKRPHLGDQIAAHRLGPAGVALGFLSGLRRSPLKTLGLLSSVRRARLRNVPALLIATVIGIAWSGSGKVHSHLHSHFGWVSGAATRAAALHSGQTYSVVLHAFEIHTAGLLDAFAATVAQEAQQIFVIAERDVATIEHHLGVRPDVLRMGVPTAWTDDPVTVRPAGRNIVSVGSLVQKKGHAYLIEAVAAAADWSLTIVGEGHLREELEALTDRLAVSDRVTLAGLQPEEEVRSLLRRSDVFALACVEADNGDRDGIPVALMEAMAAGLPIISTNVGAIAELVGGVGHLVKQRSPGDIVDSLTVLSDDNLRSSTGTAGRNRVLEAWTVESSATELCSTLFES